MPQSAERYPQDTMRRISVQAVREVLELSGLELSEPMSRQQHDFLVGPEQMHRPGECCFEAGNCYTGDFLGRPFISLDEIFIPESYAEHEEEVWRQGKTSDVMLMSNLLYAPVRGITLVVQQGLRESSADSRITVLPDEGGGFVAFYASDAAYVNRHPSHGMVLAADDFPMLNAIRRSFGDTALQRLGAEDCITLAEAVESTPCLY